MVEVTQKSAVPRSDSSQRPRKWRRGALTAIDSTAITIELLTGSDDDEASKGYLDGYFDGYQGDNDDGGFFDTTNGSRGYFEAYLQGFLDGFTPAEGSGSPKVDERDIETESYDSQEPIEIVSALAAGDDIYEGETEELETLSYDEDDDEDWVGFWDYEVDQGDLGTMYYDEGDAHGHGGEASGSWEALHGDDIHEAEDSVVGDDVDKSDEQ